jgi:hypothetical protein
MKIFWYTYCIYFLALSVMPCTDVPKSGAANALLSIKAQGSHNCPPGMAEDTCPPFCSCACCGQLCFAQSVPALGVLRSISVLFERKTTFLPSQMMQSNFLHAIFRPPQRG